MKIWIDLANAPHVSFFLPLIKKFVSENHEVIVSMRDFNQTVELAKKCGIDGSIIDRHGGKSTISKLINLMIRSIHLAKYAKGKGIDIAVSHNSYTHTIAGRITKVKVVTLMDYEGQPANHIAFRAAHKIIVPDCFPDKALRKFGASIKKVYKYKGFKEQVYLSDFIPQESFYDELVDSCDLSVDWKNKKTIIVTVRTPATMAAYHRFRNPIFEKLLIKLKQNPELTVIALPRTSQQREEIKTKFPYLKVPKYPLDGKSLVYFSDLVISAGGTMNREAAILGVPAYTIFAGSIPTVDLRLIEMERMIAISKESELDKINLVKKKPRDILRNPSLCDEIIREILHNQG